MNSFLYPSPAYIFQMDAHTERKKEQVGSGMYHAIDLDEWDDSLPVMKIGDKGRVHLPVQYQDSAIWVFISESDRILKKCNLILLPKTGLNRWEEVFQTRGKNAGDLLNVFSNGDICVKYKKGMNVKIFIKR